jgi:DNA polymerase III sliding clamp (beta) subunit (PCNA family)
MVSEDDLDLGELDLGSVVSPEEASELDAVDLSGFGEVELAYTEPHLKFDTRQFSSFLRVARQIVSNSGRDPVSKAISISVDASSGTCVLRATDYDTYFEQNIPLLNKENVLTDHLVVPLDVLLKVVKAVPAHIVFLKRDDKVFVHIVGGDLVLESYTIEKGKFLCTDTQAKIGSLSAKALFTVIKDLVGVVATSVNAPERRILFEDGNAYANYLWAIVKAEGDYPKFDLKVRDVSVLKALLLDSTETLEVLSAKSANGVSRMVLKGANFSYAFITSEVSVSNALKSSMVEVVREDSLFVDLIQLYKMVELSADLAYSTGRVGLNFDAEGNLLVSIRTKRDKDSSFVVSGSKNGSPKPLREEIQVQAKLLRLLLRVFGGTSTIQISLAEKGIGIRSEKYQAALYCEVRG